ncbi:GNAT family N-acetyltransferase [Sphaerisporangium perillae]|uniref:GNAT family N-acetyltransferase n=1 Tax=Sphaerisporangium perillae TaxID=2935860 RepID=UPI00200E0B07|nr:GNAT family N-acetyltransferase [Sphaerisporangium perillae]
MELTEFRGLRIGLLDAAEALGGGWEPHRDRLDVVRVPDPPVERWPELRRAGFLPKPFLVTWIAGTGACEEEFLTRLGPKERQNIRTARRRAAEEGLVVRTEPVDRRLLDRFLPLYASRVAEMRHGWAVAAEQKAALTQAADEHFAVSVYDGDELAGCCLGWQKPRLGLVHIRFSAVDPRRRESSLARVLYLAAAQVARERGFTAITLGMDPNVYGHIAKPGLFGFKWRLGFAGVPSQLVDPDTGTDHADLLLGLDRLCDPSFFLAYAGPRPGRELRLEVFSSTGKTDLRPFEAPFTRGRTLHLMSSRSASGAGTPARG